MISRWYLIPSTADPAREIARSFVVKAISRWYFHHSGAVAMPPCCGSYCNSYGRPSWLLQLPRQYLSLCHRSLPRGRSRNQNRNHQNNSRLHRQMIFPSGRMIFGGRGSTISRWYSWKVFGETSTIKLKRRMLNGWPRIHRQVALGVRLDYFTDSLVN